MCFPAWLDRVKLNLKVTHATEDGRVFFGKSVLACLEHQVEICVLVSQVENGRSLFGGGQPFGELGEIVRLPPSWRQVLAAASDALLPRTQRGQAQSSTLSGAANGSKAQDVVGGHSWRKQPRAAGTATAAYLAGRGAVKCTEIIHHEVNASMAPIWNQLLPALIGD